MNRINPYSEANALYAYNNVGGSNKPTSFQEKCEITKKLTGREVNESTPFVMSRESKVKFGYMGEFLRVSSYSQGGHTQFMKDSAEKYLELKKEITEQYRDDENEMYKQLSELNSAFDDALKNPFRLSPFPTRVNTAMVAIYNESDKNRHLQEIEDIKKYNSLMKEVSDNFQDSMFRHMDTFFEDFIKKSESGDFDDTFNESMSPLLNSESNSYTDISYNDLLLIKDTMFTPSDELDEFGRPDGYKYRSMEEALRVISRNESISEVVRKGIMEHLSRL